jgi:hypothetical protein
VSEPQRDNVEKIVKLGRAAAALLSSEVYVEVFEHTKTSCLEQWWYARSVGVDVDESVAAAATGFAALDGKLRALVEAGQFAEREPE